MPRERLIVQHAYKNVPFYHELFKKEGILPDDIAKLSDLQSLSILTKEGLRDNYLHLAARNCDRYKPKEETTSGSTGNPVKFLSDKSSRALEFAFYWRHWGWAGYRLGDRFAELSSHYFLKRPHRVEDIFSINRFLGRVVLNSLRISPDAIAHFAKPLRKYKPKFLKGLASTLYFFALWMHRNGIDDLSFRAVVSTGETLTGKYRSLIEKVFHCPVLDSYGHMERTVAISQCSKGGYHINSEYGILDSINSRPQSGGHSYIGSIIGTSLHNFAMPLIRYEVGDLVEFYDDPPVCPCGRTLPLIKAIHGRHEDIIVTPDRRYVTSIFIALDFVKGFDFGQFIQERKDSLVANLIKDRNYEQKDEEELMNVLRNFVGDNMKIRISYIKPEQIVRDASGKIRMVISLLKPHDY